MVPRDPGTIQALSASMENPVLSAWHNFAIPELPKSMKLAARIARLGMFKVVFMLPLLA